MEEKYVYIDCDGVVLDSAQRLLEIKESRGFINHKSQQDFYNYFALADTIEGEWEYIIKGANSLNNSVEIIRELESKKRKIAILTKVHSLKEMRIKVEDLRNNRKIYSPIIFVPPGIKKHEIIIPNGQILIDDSNENIRGWNQNNGIGILFDKDFKGSSKKKVRSLDFLLNESSNK